MEEPAKAPRERELEPALTPVRARPSRPGRTEGFLGVEPRDGSPKGRHRGRSDAETGMHNQECQTARLASFQPACEVHVRLWGG